MIALPSHPFPRFGPANLVTAFRLLLVVIVGLLLLRAPAPALAWWVVGLMMASAALDGVDGWLARRTGLASAFGAWFDMETDALLILAVSAGVWRYDKAGAWVLGCGLMRYAFVASRWVLPWMAGRLSPTFRGKAVAVGQLIGLGLALAPPVPARASGPIAAVTLAVLAWSFAVDVRRLWVGRAG